jgi:hypothetical protein
VARRGYREALPRRHRGSVRARRPTGYRGEATPETSDHRRHRPPRGRDQGGGVVRAQRPAGSRRPPGIGSWPSGKRSASSRTARPACSPMAGPRSPGRYYGPGGRPRRSSTAMKCFPAPLRCASPALCRTTPESGQHGPAQRQRYRAARHWRSSVPGPGVRRGV